jgi:hypothetical protein
VAEFQISRSARHLLTLFSVAGSFESSGSVPRSFLRRCSTLQAGGLSTFQNLFKVDLVHDMLQSRPSLACKPADSDVQWVACILEPRSTIFR